MIECIPKDGTLIKYPLINREGFSNTFDSLEVVNLWMPTASELNDDID